MRTVDQVLEQIYGGKPQAAVALGTKRNAPWNWSKVGHFPAPIAIQISLDARNKGAEIPLEEIPTFASKRADA